MKTKTRVRAGMIMLNHNERSVRDQGKATGLTVKTRIRAANHNEALAADTPDGGSPHGRGPAVQTRIEAGANRRGG